MNAIIVGGGIGGLTAAIALECVGIQADVYERAPELSEVGAGITLWANALYALELLGIRREMLQPAPIDFDGSIRTRSGRVLTTASYAEFKRRSGAAFLVMHRAELLAVLSHHVGEGRLHAGHECVGFAEDERGVTARFANGATAFGDILIGADGLRSVVRSALFGNEPPRYAGYTAWRSVVDMGSRPIPAGESWENGKRFGIVPLGDGRVYWFAVHNEPEGASDEPYGGPRQHLLRLFENWHEPIVDLIAATDERSITRGDIYDRNPLRTWTRGRVTLLGDAAHATTPNLGQGACQAIEDAVELAACLNTGADVPAALMSYEKRRIPRTSKVIVQSRRIGAMAQWQNPILCAFRNALLAATPKGVTERQLTWLIGYRVPPLD